ncbi:hypothetical protein [Psychroserpens ponticola]|uniref:Uncharacterized protein n=1 Tax=Psychroserpens ponticola TaxID=2932268 RepID=A0ABY7RXK9_9FLAO|nr:hypothetical protein [Psychroserpens ponticola]WCO00435.1 hypothetical protein MUN68_010170 [Psychroserpens ponticola]
MKKLACLLVLATSFAFSQTSAYEIEVDKDKKISSLIHFTDNSFVICASKQSLGYKSNDPKLIRIDSTLNEIYTNSFTGFTNFFDFSIDGAMLNNYRHNPKMTASKDAYSYINSQGEILEIEKDLLSGGEEIKNNGERFLIDNTQFTIGTREGKEFSKDVYNQDDFYLYKLNLKTGVAKIQKMNFQGPSDMANDGKFYFSLFKLTHDSFTIKLKKSTRDVKEKLYTEIFLLTFDLNGKKIKETKIGAPLKNDKNTALNKVWYDKIDKAFYSYGFYHEHKNANRKWAVTKFKGYYIQKYDITGKSLWDIQAPFSSDIFDDNQSNMDCIFTLNKVNKTRLLFSYGNTDIDVLNMVQIDKNTGKTIEENVLEFKSSYNNRITNYPVDIEHRIMKDVYGKKVFLDVNTIQLLAIHEEFNTYIKQFKNSKDKIHYKSFILEDGFIVFEASSDANDYKFLKFNW